MRTWTEIFEESYIKQVFFTSLVIFKFMKNYFFMFLL